MYTGPKIVKDGLRYHIDFASENSYVGTGDTVYNLVEPNTIIGTLNTTHPPIYDNLSHTTPVFQYNIVSGKEISAVSASSGMEFISGSPHTIDIWIKQSFQGSTDRCAFSVGSAPNTRKWIHIVWLNDTSLRWGLWSDDIDATTTAAEGEWVNYTFTLDSNLSRSIYENGVVLNSNTATDYFSGTGAWAVGCWNRLYQHHRYRHR